MEIIALIIIIAIVINLQAFIFKKKAFDKLKYNCRFSHGEAYEGEELELIETVENNKLFPVPWLKVSIHSSRWLDFAGSVSSVSQEGRYTTSSFFLNGYQKTTRRWKLKCLKRGIYTIENVTFLSGDLLGISSTSIPVPVNVTLRVYPTVISIEDLFVPVNYLQGDTIVKRWIIDDPFVISGAREYTSRDSMNRIHWNATARTGKLMVKKNDFTSQQSFSILLNVQSIENEYSETIDKETIEFGIKVAATIIDRALRMGMPARLGINAAGANDGKKTIFTGDSAGKDHLFQLMGILAELKLKSNKEFDLFLKDIEYEMDNSDIFIITSYINDSIAWNARELQKSSNRVTLLLLDESGVDELPGDLDIYYIPRQVA